MPSVSEMALLKLDPVGAFNLLGGVGFGFDPQVIRVCYPHPDYSSSNSSPYSSRALMMINPKKKRALVCLGRDVKTNDILETCPPFRVFEALATGIYHELFKSRGFHPSSLRFSDYSPVSRKEDMSRRAWGLKVPSVHDLSLTPPGGAWRLMNLQYRDDRYLFQQHGPWMRRQYLVPSAIDELSDTISSRELNLRRYVESCKPSILIS